MPPSLQKDSTWKRLLKMRKLRLFWLFLCLKIISNTKKLQQNYMEDIFIPWYELTEQSKVAESVRCSSFFSFFSDRGPCKDCLYRKFHYDLIYWVEHSAFF